MYKIICIYFVLLCTPSSHYLNATCMDLYAFTGKTAVLHHVWRWANYMLECLRWEWWWQRKDAPSPHFWTNLDQVAVMKKPLELPLNLKRGFFIFFFIFSLGGLEANSSGIPLDLVPPRFDIGSQCFQVAKHQCHCCLPLSSLFFQVTSGRIACHKVRQMEICIKTQGELDIHGWGELKIMSSPLMSAWLPWLKVGDGPALSGRLDKMTFGNPFQPALLQSKSPWQSTWYVLFTFTIKYNSPKMADFTCT